MSKLEAKEWPNSPGTFELHVHNQRVGHATKVGDGWLVFNKRKPVATLEAAAKQCIDKQISQHNNEIQKLRAMLATVLRPNALAQADAACGGSPGARCSASMEEA